MADDTLRFTVLGRPQGKGSKHALPVKRKNGERTLVVVDSNKRARPWASQVSAAALEAHGRRELLRGCGIYVSMRFVFARPKSHHGRRGLRPSAPLEMFTMPDIDKLARCALDALTGIVFHDDAQVARLWLTKCYGEPERLEVEVRELPPRAPAPIAGQTTIADIVA